MSGLSSHILRKIQRVFNGAKVWPSQEYAIKSSTCAQEHSSLLTGELQTINILCVPFNAKLPIAGYLLNLPSGKNERKTRPRLKSQHVRSIFQCPPRAFPAPILPQVNFPLLHHHHKKCQKLRLCKSAT